MRKEECPDQMSWGNTGSKEVKRGFFWEIEIT